MADAVPTEATPSRSDRYAQTEEALRATGRAAIRTNRDFLDMDPPPTPTQNAAQVRALTRQMSGLIRLILAGDLLEQDGDSEPTPPPEGG